MALILIIYCSLIFFFCQFLEDAAGLAKLHGKEIFVDRIKYLNIDKVGVDYKIGRARFRIRDQGTGSKILSEAINNFLNHNWREVLEEMKHTASSAIEKYVKQIVNKALLKIPVDLWLLEETGDRIPVTLKKWQLYELGKAKSRV